jgi:hypothetical protein
MFDPVLVQSRGNQLSVEFGPAVILAIVRAADLHIFRTSQSVPRNNHEMIACSVGRWFATNVQTSDRGPSITSA